MTKTGLYATPEEFAEAKRLAEEAANTPVIAPTGGQDLASQAWERTKQHVHKAALAHGLPEIPGYYGMTNKGQFVTAEIPRGRCGE